MEEIMTRARFITLLAGTLASALIAFAARPAAAQMRIRDLCRLKGQEEVTLQGLGLVVGLKGTGDPSISPTTRALARMLTLMGSPLPKDKDGGESLKELKDAKNVALVLVTATVPAAGARQGDRINCQVSAISAKSLDGGVLMLTPLLGPRPPDPLSVSGSPRVYATAQGPLHLDNLASPAAARIHNGCRLDADFFNPFVEDGKITLVLDKNHANFQTVQEIAELINNQPDFRYSGDDVGNVIATAKDQVTIEVSIPPKYADDPVLFVSEVLSRRVFNPQNEARVVVNERSGTVIIGSEVSIGSVAVTHKNIAIEAGPFVPLDPSSSVQNATKLKALVDTLNAIKAEPQDIVDIIKGLERNGQLYGRLIIE
jgi:flagellar P-ring protein precursor FlgI